MSANQGHAMDRPSALRIIELLQLRARAADRAEQRRELADFDDDDAPAARAIPPRTNPPGALALSPPPISAPPTPPRQISPETSRRRAMIHSLFRDPDEQEIVGDLSPLDILETVARRYLANGWLDEAVAVAAQAAPYRHARAITFLPRHGSGATTKGDAQ